MRRDFNSAFPEQKMEPEVEFESEPESESESDSDSDEDPDGAWTSSFDTGCLPYEKLDLENWTNPELFQLAYVGIAVYNAAHNTNYEFEYIMKSVFHQLIDVAHYIIDFSFKDDKAGIRRAWTYTWVGDKPSLGIIKAMLGDDEKDIS